MKRMLRWGKRILLTMVSLILLVLIPIGVSSLYENIRSSRLSDQEKNMEDVARLEYVMQNEFSGYTVLKKKEVFESQVTSLRRQVQTGEISREAFQLEVIKAVASFKDPHTGIYNTEQLFTDYFPYRVEWRKDGFYLVAGNVEERWLGAKVSHFEGMDGASVFDKLSQYTNSPNRSGNARFMGPFQALPALFQHEGIIADANPNDPVVSIVDYELHSFEGNTFGKVKTLFPILGKLVKRYYQIITTDKVMNDDYNAFIGK